MTGFDASRITRWTLLALVVAFHARAALAQQNVNSPAAESLNTESDVLFSLESERHTSAARLQALSDTLTPRFEALRVCYRTALRARPSVTGKIKVRISVVDGALMSLAVVEDNTSDAPLLACVLDVLRGASVTAVPRPASAVAVMSFHNTGASGALAAEGRAATAQAVDVQRANGIPTARGQVTNIDLLVEGAADTPDDAVIDSFRVVRAQTSSLFDCRRRAGRRGRSPAGIVELRLSLQPGRPVTVEVLRSTVADPQAAQCVRAAISRTSHRPTIAVSGVRSVITFAP